MYDGWRGLGATSTPAEINKNTTGETSMNRTHNLHAHPRRRENRTLRVAFTGVVDQAKRVGA